MVEAVIFDVGGVITTSPFGAFTRFERANGLPAGFLVRLNATNPDDNAWARLERNEVNLAQFAELFEGEARAAGHAVNAAAVLDLLTGESRPVLELRPEMVEALRRCHERLRTALLTNNFVRPGDAAGTGAMAPVMAAIGDHVDVVVESSRVGVRKPDPAIYELVCAELAIEPRQAVFLDDLGVNLKPARAMGMTTIKVTDPADALAELEDAVGFAMR